MAALTSIQFRRGTAAQWTAANPVLSAGELGYETDTGEFKIGDGTTAWITRPYWISDVAGHSHPSSQISDSTATGRSVLTAVDAAAARAAIGAGTSNLIIGTGAANAMAGNKTFAFSEITGQIGTAQLPPLAINEVYTAASQTAMLALAAQRGDMAIRTDIGETYVLSTDSPATLADWKMITSPGNVTSVAGRQGAVVLTKTDVGLANVDNTSDANKPVSTATQTALNAKEPTIAAGTTAQYWRGDKTWATNDKASVGLGSVDNTSDINKPVSSATQTALNGKANLASPTFTGTVGGITKTMVGLSNVDNTTDANKPVSTATQTALNGKANTSHTHSSADILSIDGGTP
jgi:hypothetical protein